jgi:hypothetical protein
MVKITLPLLKTFFFWSGWSGRSGGGGARGGEPESGRGRGRLRAGISRARSVPRRLLLPAKPELLREAGSIGGRRSKTEGAGPRPEGTRGSWLRERTEAERGRERMRGAWVQSGRAGIDATGPMGLANRSGAQEEVILNPFEGASSSSKANPQWSLLSFTAPLPWQCRCQMLCISFNLCFNSTK